MGWRRRTAAGDLGCGDRYRRVALVACFWGWGGRGVRAIRNEKLLKIVIFDTETECLGVI